MKKRSVSILIALILVILNISAITYADSNAYYNPLYYDDIPLPTVGGGFGNGYADDGLSVADLHGMAYADAYAGGGIKVYVNGNKINFDVEPEIKNGRTMVPLRAIFEALGAIVNWDASTRKVTAYRDADMVELRIGDYSLYTSNGIKTLDQPGYITNGRTLVPARAVSEAFNCDVQWYQDKKLVSIVSNDKAYRETVSSGQYDGGYNDSDYSSSDIYAMLTDMMNGYSYNGVYQANTSYNGVYAGEQCKGFAKDVHEKLFGYNIGSTKSKPDNYMISISSSKTNVLGSVTVMSESNLRNMFNSARPGDFVQIRRNHGGSHSAIVYETSYDGVTFYEANVDGKNGIIVKTYTWSDLIEKNAAMSVYTAKNYPEMVFSVIKIK